MWASWVGTVAEAVFLIGAERNTDHIIGASYASLPANLNDFQWTVSSPRGLATSLYNIPQQPDLICFTADSSQDVSPTSYYQIQVCYSSFGETYSNISKALLQYPNHLGPAYRLGYWLRTCILGGGSQLEH